MKIGFVDKRGMMWAEKEKRDGIHGITRTALHGLAPFLPAFVTLESNLAFNALSGLAGRTKLYSFLA
jgi:hypothetical protein